MIDLLMGVVPVARVPRGAARMPNVVVNHYGKRVMEMVYLVKALRSVHKRLDGTRASLY